MYKRQLQHAVAPHSILLSISDTQTSCSENSLIPFSRLSIFIKISIPLCVGEYIAPVAVALQAKRWTLLCAREEIVRNTSPPFRPPPLTGKKIDSFDAVIHKQESPPREQFLAGS